MDWNGLQCPQNVSTGAAKALRSPEAPCEQSEKSCNARRLLQTAHNDDEHAWSTPVQSVKLSHAQLTKGTQLAWMISILYDQAEGRSTTCTEPPAYI